MKTSLIINTAALDPWVHGANPHRSSDYRRRYSLLKERVLPAAISQDFDEIIVAGVYEDGPGYRYLPVAPRFRDRRDALVQREQGARHSSGEVLVFSHDDHALAADFNQVLKSYTGEWGEYAKGWDLLMPQRIHGITGAVMNNGFEAGPNKTSYMGSHALVMKRWLWASVPWTSVDTEYWDTTLTRMWEQAGGKLVFANDLQHVDVEVAAGES